MEGNSDIDIEMIPVNAAIRRHVKNSDAFTDIYNRAYEALMRQTDNTDTLRAELAALKEQNAGCTRMLSKLMTEHRELVEAVEKMLDEEGCYPEHAKILYKLLPEPPEVENE